MKSLASCASCIPRDNCIDLGMWPSKFSTMEDLLLTQMEHWHLGIEAYELLRERTANLALYFRSTTPFCLVHSQPGNFEYAQGAVGACALNAHSPDQQYTP